MIEKWIKRLLAEHLAAAAEEVKKQVLEEFREDIKKHCLDAVEAVITCPTASERDPRWGDWVPTVRQTIIDRAGAIAKRDAEKFLASCVKGEDFIDGIIDRIWKKQLRMGGQDELHR